MSGQDPELPAVTEGDGNGQPLAKMVRLEDLERTVSELVRKSLVPGQALAPREMYRQAKVSVG